MAKRNCASMLCWQYSAFLILQSLHYVGNCPRVVFHAFSVLTDHPTITHTLRKVLMVSVLFILVISMLTNKASMESLSVLDDLLISVTAVLENVPPLNHWPIVLSSWRGKLNSWRNSCIITGERTVMLLCLSFVVWQYHGNKLLLTFSHQTVFMEIYCGRS